MTTNAIAAGVFGDATSPTLTIESVITKVIAPEMLCVTLKYTDHRLFSHGELHNGGLASRHILPGDLLIFDRGRTRPKDGDLVMVQDGQDWPIRIYRDTPHGPEYYNDDPGSLIVGERRVHATVVALVRVDGQMDGGRL